MRPGVLSATNMAASRAPSVTWSIDVNNFTR
jgi:hypothetical protein